MYYLKPDMYEKCAEAKRLRERGLTFKEIGKEIGHSPNVARERVRKFDLEQSRRQAKKEELQRLAAQPPPWYAGLSGLAIDELRSFRGMRGNILINSRESCMRYAGGDEYMLDRLPNYRGGLTRWRVIILPEDGSPFGSLSVKSFDEIRAWLDLAPLKKSRFGSGYRYHGG